MLRTFLELRACLKSSKVQADNVWLCGYRIGQDCIFQSETKFTSFSIWLFLLPLNETWKGAAVIFCLKSAPELWITSSEWQKYILTENIKVKCAAFVQYFDRVSSEYGLSTPNLCLNVNQEIRSSIVTAKSCEMMLWNSYNAVVLEM